MADGRDARVIAQLEFTFPLGSGRGNKKGDPVDRLVFNSSNGHLSGYLYLKTSACAKLKPAWSLADN